jgi:hypothetical protein
MANQLKMAMVQSILSFFARLYFCWFPSFLVWLIAPGKSASRRYSSPYSRSVRCSPCLCF